jgi:mitogen-activated protein kinase 1/3
MSSLRTNDPYRTFFDVREEYAVREVVGEGAYSIVRSAIHKPTGQVIAIKKTNPFGHSMFCLRTMRELLSLRHFHHENIIPILDVQRPRSYDNCQDIYLSCELIEMDLHSVIHAQKLSNDHCQYLTSQVLRALKAIHSANLLHCGLKPSNLLVNFDCDLKVCGFGLARLAATAGARHGAPTELVGSRWYRAPEVMLTPGNNTTAIDMWSVGCILAEMLDGKPLLLGGGYDQQLTLIFDLLGTPTTEDCDAVNSRRARRYLHGIPLKSKMPWKQTLPRALGLALNLLAKLLTFNPTKRISA